LNMAPDCLQIKVNRQAKAESQLIALRNDCGFLRQRLHWFEIWAILPKNGIASHWFWWGCQDT